MAHELESIEEMLDRISEIEGEDDRISLGAITEAVGSRSFGPLMLTVGFFMVSPLSGMPGMPTTMATLVLLIAVQMIIGRNHFWLPAWLLRRSIPRKRLNKAMSWMKMPARHIDLLLKPRFAILVRSFGTYAIAVSCLIIAAGMPIMELVPFSASAAGVAVGAFGLALVARDGLVALFAYLWTGVSVVLIMRYIF
ncbi:exopolysaccharide biosynthesis protein [Desulfonatronum parangueonense]